MLDSMSKRIRITLGLLLIPLAFIVAWEALRPREPLYQGRTMSSWINCAPQSGVDDPNLAMRVWSGFGSNATPFLREKLTATDGAAKKAYWAMRRHLPNWMNRRLTYDPPPSELIRWRAADGLGFIGKAAAPAVPDLVRMYKTDQDKSMPPGFMRGRAVAALANIGQYLTAEAPQYHSVIDTLIEALHDSSAEVRSLAASDLKDQFPEAAAKAGVK
jgi:hypothetical protein